MVPSSRMISQITPEGLRPASREMSHAASVWPARTSTPPSRARSGKTWPGVTMSALPLLPSIATADGAGAVGGGNAGGDALARLDRDGEGGFVAGAVVPAHQVEAELLDALAGQRQADQAAAVRGHEVDRIGRRHLRRNDQVALVLAVLVVDQDVHAAVARLVDDLLDRDEHRAVVVGEQEAFELAERIGGGVPARLGAIAQGVGVEPGGAGEAGPGHAAVGDEGADLVDGVVRHVGRAYHIIM